MIDVRAIMNIKRTDIMIARRLNIESASVFREGQEIHRYLRSIFGAFGYCQQEMLKFQLVLVISQRYPNKFSWLREPYEISSSQIPEAELHKSNSEKQVVRPAVDAAQMA